MEHKLKVLIAPISSNEKLLPITHDVCRRLRSAGITTRIDDSNVSIGRRYARNDELGIPYACTIDFDTESKGTLMLRERDTTAQRIGTIDEMIETLKQLGTGGLDWSAACARLGKVA